MGPGAAPDLSAPAEPAEPADGVGRSRVALPPGPWPRVLDFLSERFAHVPRARWQARMERGDVRDADGRPVSPAQPYRPGGRLHYFREVEHEKPGEPARLLYRDARLMVLDKPHGQPVVPGGAWLRSTTLAQARRLAGHDDVAPLHRLDRDTAGLVLFSTCAHSRAAYHALFRERQVHKVYEAVAPWRGDLRLPLVRCARIGPAERFPQQQELPGEPQAITRIELLAHDGELALYRLLPRTGRRHQLRVHMAALGLPICNDRVYPRLLPPAPDDPAAPLQLLARSLAFTDPVDGRSHQWRSERQLAWPPRPGPGSVGVRQAADQRHERDAQQQP